MAKLAKFTLWFLRIFQHIIALILIGVTAYMTHEFVRFHYNLPQEVLVPLLFSCLALFVSFWSLIAICCLNHHLQLLAAILDFIILAGFITSVALLHDNFHADDSSNQLRNWLIYVRLANKQSPRETRTGGLVKALDAGVILMMILFFFTTLLSFYIAMESARKHHRESSYTGGSRSVSRHSRSHSGSGHHHHHQEVSTTDGYDTYDTTESSYISSSDQYPPPRRH